VGKLTCRPHAYTSFPIKYLSSDLLLCDSRYEEIKCEYANAPRKPSYHTHFLHTLITLRITLAYAHLKEGSSLRGVGVRNSFPRSNRGVMHGRTTLRQGSDCGPNRSRSRRMSKTRLWLEIKGGMRTGVYGILRNMKDV